MWTKCLAFPMGNKIAPIQGSASVEVSRFSKQNRDKSFPRCQIKLSQKWRESVWSVVSFSSPSPPHLNGPPWNNFTLETCAVKSERENRRVLDPNASSLVGYCSFPPTSVRNKATAPFKKQISNFVLQIVQKLFFATIVFLMDFPFSLFLQVNKVSSRQKRNQRSSSKRRNSARYTDRTRNAGNAGKIGETKKGLPISTFQTWSNKSETLFFRILAG